MADTATLQARLAEAEDALHRLKIGGGVAEVQTDNERVKYSPANVAALETYIADLKRELGILPPRRAIGVNFA